MTDQQQYYLGFVIGFLAIPAMILIGIAIDQLHRRWKNKTHREEK